MKIDELTPTFSEFIPDQLEPGFLYISREYSTATHLCPCGCNSKVVTPLKPGMWRMIETNNKVSLLPSIGSFNLPCRSHYFINENRIVWA